MGNCIYCGSSAGLFRTKHPECEQQSNLRENRIQEGRIKLVGELTAGIRSDIALSLLEGRVLEIEGSLSVPSHERKTHLAKAWDFAVESFFQDGVLDQTEEARLEQFKEHFGLSQTDLDSNGSFSRIVKAGILREIFEGKIPSKVAFDGRLPINFQKNEQIVWAFPNAPYLEDKIKRQYRGRSQGVSVRIMKGVYYRVGDFRGHAVEYTERIHVDTGWVAITNKHIYFAGPRKSLRLPYSKIVSFEPFDDGIGIIRDAPTAKPQVFVTGDGWFTYNLVVNLAQM